ncbi:hypothetical protein H8L32_07480 [Undibacterium sp. CY18W]|uniref:Uncharacterized protein n=1 Tax=Undibacterium hunanense TaxID=2762292 RepID=A0ABR6ZN36_9BURK|nr:hypothetical protein [Undibacterium hunanense]MBC3917311.1 hypothetical protein [Undibacterium hunanense]
MIDPNTAAYRPMPTGLTKTAVFSPNPRKLGEKRKVQVKNTAYPFDELTVSGWITNDVWGESFVFEDGKLGHTVSLNLAEVKDNMLRN